MTYDWNASLNFSLGQQQVTDVDTIKSMLVGSVAVRNATAIEQRLGVDYVATLRRGATVLVDAKTRRIGCSKYWSGNRPELALEVWSVMPGGKYNTPKHLARTGWTLAEDKQTDLVLFKWDPEDTKTVFLIGFQPLRMAFSKNLPQWRKAHKVDIQSTTRNDTHWESEAIMVPAHIVQEAIRRCSIGEQPAPNPKQSIPLTPSQLQR